MSESDWRVCSTQQLMQSFYAERDRAVRHGLPQRTAPRLDAQDAALLNSAPDRSAFTGREDLPQAVPEAESLSLGGQTPFRNLRDEQSALAYAWRTPATGGGRASELDGHASAKHALQLEMSIDPVHSGAVWQGSGNRTEDRSQEGFLSQSSSSASSLRHSAPPL